jgi:DNA-binding transcriptional LysR family regulator
MQDDLVWAGATEGTARNRDPLPVSIGDEKCEFRPSVLKALRGAGRDWRPVCEVSSMEPLLASIEADLSVAPLLRSTIPPHLQEVARDSRLPRLPKFLINLYLPPVRQSEIALELARHIRQEFAARAHRPRRQNGRARRQPALAAE